MPKFYLRATNQTWTLVFPKHIEDALGTELVGYEVEVTYRQAQGMRLLLDEPPRPIAGQRARRNRYYLARGMKAFLGREARHQT